MCGSWGGHFVWCWFTLWSHVTSCRESAAVLCFCYHLPPSFHCPVLFTHTPLFKLSVPLWFLTGPQNFYTPGFPKFWAFSGPQNSMYVAKTGPARAPKRNSACVAILTTGFLAAVGSCWNLNFVVEFWFWICKSGFRGSWDFNYVAASDYPEFFNSRREWWVGFDWGKLRWSFGLACYNGGTISSIFPFSLTPSRSLFIFNIPSILNNVYSVLYCELI